MLMRLSALLPVALSIVAFVLSFLLIFAGHKESFLEKYDLIRLNTSTLGYDLIPTSDEAEEDRDGIGGFIDDLGDDVKDKINEMGNDVADRLSDELGISEWYSIHMMSLCRGDFEPNATDSDPDLNVTSCTKSSPDNRVNLTELIDSELTLGPLEMSLADINWPDDIDDAIELVNRVLLALFILYCFAIGFSGLAMLGSLAAVILDPLRPKIGAINLVFALLASVVLLAGSIGVTVGARKGADEITDRAGAVGVSASAGEEFIILSWVAFAVMAATVVYWTAMVCFRRRETRRYGGKSWN